MKVSNLKVGKDIEGIDGNTDIFLEFSRRKMNSRWDGSRNMSNILNFRSSESLLSNPSHLYLRENLYMFRDPKTQLLEQTDAGRVCI